MKQATICKMAFVSHMDMLQIIYQQYDTFMALTSTRTKYSINTVNYC